MKRNDNASLVGLYCLCLIILEIDTQGVMDANSIMSYTHTHIHTSEMALSKWWEHNYHHLCSFQGQNLQVLDGEKIDPAV